jgi:hypothetical protein
MALSNAPRPLPRHFGFPLEACGCVHVSAVQRLGGFGG